MNSYMQAEYAIFNYLMKNAGFTLDKTMVLKTWHNRGGVLISRNFLVNFGLDLKIQYSVENEV